MRNRRRVSGQEELRYYFFYVEVMMVMMRVVAIYIRSTSHIPTVPDPLHMSSNASNADTAPSENVGS